MTSTPSNSTSGAVRIGIAGGIGTVTFSHPKGNSLPGQLLHALADAVRARGLSAAVLTGEVKQSLRACIAKGSECDPLPPDEDCREATS